MRAASEHTQSDMTLILLLEVFKIASGNFLLIKFGLSVDQRVQLALNCLPTGKL